MTSKYMKKCSAALDIKEGQSKMTLSFQFTLDRMAIINNTNKQQTLARMQGKRNPHTFLGGM
jgi:hypothetical protein